MTYLINTDAPVLVTGASGYVAGWIVNDLLQQGVTVHAALRDPTDKQKTLHLEEMARSAPGTLKFFAADLLEPGSYADAMKDCAVVFHTASPFTSKFDDPQTELVDPALEGTRNVLASVNQTSSVSRVVLTSSVAAIYADAADCADAPGGRLDETVWNTSAALDYQPYAYSKTVAEHAAWEIAKAQDRWKLVVLNPSLVVGPAKQEKPTSESFNIVRQLGNGTMKAGAPRVGLGVVDVRDLAKAHISAAYTRSAEGRHIISAHETDLLELGRSLQDKFGNDYPLPKRALPKWLVWAAGPLMAGLSRRYVSRNVDVAWRADTSKGKRKLGATYRPLKTSMEEMFTQMIRDDQFAQDL